MEKSAPIEVKALTEMHEQLILKAWSDPAFKAELLKDPAKAVEKLLGIKVPSFIKIQVLQETADTRYITLPYHVAEGDRHLNDDELERVAGGASRSGGYGQSGTSANLPCRDAH
jgi:hypothetical protein